LLFQIRFLNQLGSLIDQLTREQSKVRSMYAKLDNGTNSILQTPNIKSTMTSVNNVKDLIDYMKEIDIVYQDGDITDEHIRISKYWKIISTEYVFIYKKFININQSEYH